MTADVGTGIAFAETSAPLTDATFGIVADVRVYGALAFNFRNGNWFAIRARAVILAAGEVNRISLNVSGVP